MLTFLSYRPCSARFYRVDVTYNLFGEYSVIREWGRTGGKGRHMVACFGNLRDALRAADRWHKHAFRRGYRMVLREQTLLQ
ncbi:MAG: WGR domain-containing protein [Roseinatronobacter sp.]|jgi:predicted DNA-binding WGR domain protein|nr:WGR domain-containing protein [Roseinatronobacter sp.]